MENNLQNHRATFGAGCFWCVEAVFLELKGVLKVISGYTGGHIEEPTYEQVCSGTTGHAEVIQIEFNPEIISYSDLLTVLWHVHDPTTLNRQGNDIGTQYRSVIYYHDEDQKHSAEQSKVEVEQSGLWTNPIVTTIEPLTTFYPAEDYHQNYYNENLNQGYCSVLIAPKIQKFRIEFADQLK